MPRPVIFALMIETAFVVLTLVLLMQPVALFRPEAARMRAVGRFFGWTMLCVTFCWSMVVGGLWAILAPLATL